MESESISRRPSNRIIFYLTEKLFLNRRDIEEIPLHHRGGKGIIATMLHHGDSIRSMVTCSPSETLYFFTDGGYVFGKKVSEISEFGRKGIDIREIIQIHEDDIITTIFAADEEELEHPDLHLLFATEKGLVKKTKAKEFRRIQKNGKLAIRLREGDRLKEVKKLMDNTHICLASSRGRMVKFSSSSRIINPETGKEEDNFPPSSRTARGRYGLHTSSDFPLVSASTTLEGSLLFSIGSRGLGKISRIEDYREVVLGRRRGVKAQRTNEKTGPLLACTLVNENDEILLVTSNNKINRFKVSEISVQNPDTMGVILLRLEEDERIISFAKN